MRKAHSLYVLLVVLLACEETAEISPDDGDLSYFPIGIGNTWTYEVTEIHYEISGFDTLQYLLRETLTDTIITTAIPTYVMERNKSWDSGMTWELDSVWMIRQSATDLVLTQNNIPFTKMVYPIVADKSWDQNVYNTLQSDLVYYREPAGFIPTFGSIMQEDIIKVELKDIPPNIVSQDQQFEYYAAGIGLLEKESTILNFCTTSDCDSTGQILNGFYELRQLIEFRVQ